MNLDDDDDESGEGKTEEKENAEKETAEEVIDKIVNSGDDLACEQGMFIICKACRVRTYFLRTYINVSCLTVCSK